MSGRRGLILFFLLSVCLVVSAQTDTWQAWLYDAGSGDLTLIDGQGFIRSQATLPLTQNMSLYPYNVAVSASGARLAYILSDTHRSELVVYDPRPGIRDIVLRYALPDVIADTLSLSSTVGQLFAPDETRLAFGYSRQGGGWDIVLIDTQSDQASLILKGGAGRAADLPIDRGITPVIRSFDGVRVAFTLVQAGVTSFTGKIWPSYLWDIQANTIVAAPAYAALDGDVFAPTGEIIEAVTDDQPHIALFPDRTAAEPLILTQTPSSGALLPQFVQNGMAILYAILDDRQRMTYQLLRRGAAQPETWQAGSTQIIGSRFGTATGFAYTVDLTNSDGTNAMTLYHLDTTGELTDGTPLFAAPAFTHPRLIWLNDPRLTPAPLWNDPTPIATQVAAYTQADTWQLWIYQDNGVAVRVDNQGRALDLEAIPPENALPGIVDGDILRPTRLSASPDGTLLVYALGVNDSMYVQVYDTRQNRVLMTHRIDESLGTRAPTTLDRAPHNLFNETQTAFAFGYGKAQGWQIDVLDATSGDIFTSLLPESPAMRSLITDTAFGVVPVIQAFVEGKVSFTIQGAGSFTPPYPSFVWDTVTGGVNPTLLYANPMVDTFAASGEVIMAMIDPRLPNSADRFLYGQVNALHVYDPTTGTRTPFYNAQTLWLQQPIFIQNGERILSGGVNASGAFAGWTVVERDGEVAGLLPLTDDLIAAVGTGSGFVYIPRDEAGNNLSLYYVNTRQALDAGQPIWSIPRTGRPQIVWAAYPTQEVAYRPWRSLAVPVDVGQVTLVETPQVAVVLAAGGTATVRTTGGDALLLRDAAGLDANVLTRLNSGTRITLLRGPATVAGKDWWQIQTPGGAVGWVVTEIDGIKTLTPEGD